MTAKPPLPAGIFDNWERITVDEDGPFYRVRRIATRAADDWLLGDAGPYKTPAPMSMAEITGNVVREALLHLLELGLIDIDEARMDAAKGWPVSRRQFIAREEPQP